MSNYLVPTDTALALLQEKELPDLSAIELHWQRMKDLLNSPEKKQLKRAATGMYAAVIMLLFICALIWFFRPEGEKTPKNESGAEYIDQSPKIPPAKSVLPLLKKDSMQQIHVPKTKLSVNLRDTIPVAKPNPKPSLNRMIVYPGVNSSKTGTLKDTTVTGAPIDAQEEQKKIKNRSGFRRKQGKDSQKKVQLDSLITIR